MFNNIKTKLVNFGNFLKEKFSKNIFNIQFALTILLTVALSCSMFMINNLYDQLDDVTEQIDSIVSSMESQESDETEEDTCSEVESDTDDEATSSDTSSDSTVSTPAPTSTPSTSTSTSTTTSTNVTTGTTTDLDLLACVIYQEAGGNGSCDECRRRVADIVLNRVMDGRFPNTIREVLTARNQYGRFYYTGIVWPSRSVNPGEQAAVARAYRIAEEVLNGQHSDMFNNGYIWQAGFKQGKDIIYCCGHYYGR